MRKLFSYHICHCDILPVANKYCLILTCDRRCFAQTCIESQSLWHALLYTIINYVTTNDTSPCRITFMNTLCMNMYRVFQQVGCEVYGALTLHVDYTYLCISRQVSLVEHILATKRRHYITLYKHTQLHMVQSRTT